MMYIEEKMEKAKLLLAGLFAVDDLAFEILLYDDDTKKLKQVNDVDKKPKLRIGIDTCGDVSKMYIQLKFKEGHFITAEEMRKRYNTNVKKHSENHLVS